MGRSHGRVDHGRTPAAQVGAHRDATEPTPGGDGLAVVQGVRMRRRRYQGYRHEGLAKRLLHMRRSGALPIMFALFCPTVDVTHNECLQLSKH